MFCINTSCTENEMEISKTQTASDLQLNNTILIKNQPKFSVTIPHNRCNPNESDHNSVRHCSVKREPQEMKKKLTQSYLDLPQLILNVDKSKITNLLVEEGSPMFAFWFIVSSYLPIFTACLCPMANMVSIAGLITNWRRDPDTTSYVKDATNIFVLNILSLTMGAVANISIILNFGKRVSYKICQVVSIFGFFSASAFLLVAVLLANHNYFQTAYYEKTEGFWFAVITVLLYAGCCFLCALNFSGFLLSKYPPDFNLSNAERGLIIYAFMLAIWFIWGAAVFSRLINISYGNALYYCTVSLLTIGFGDIVPTNDSGRVLALIYSLTGIIILGLIIAVIRSMITSEGRPVLFWNQVEVHRKAMLKKIHDQRLNVSQEDSFDLMRSIKKQTRLTQKRFYSVMTVLIFIGFWLIGGLIFHFTEGWHYFDAIYFCFLCLLTIGYGEFAPNSSAGRPIFIIWSLSSVPLMTALISSVGDTVYGIAMSDILLSIITKALGRNNSTHDWDSYAYIQGISEEELEMNEERSVNEIMTMVSRRERMVYIRKKVFEGMKKLIIDSKDSSFKCYSFKQWNIVMELLKLDVDNVKNSGIDDNLFWLSDESHLRYPINEHNYLLFLLSNKMESLMTEEVERLEKSSGAEVAVSAFSKDHESSN